MLASVKVWYLVFSICSVFNVAEIYLLAMSSLGR